MASVDSGQLQSVRALAKHPLLWLAVLILALACYRFSLIGSGHFFWADERCFLPAADFVDAVTEGEYRTGTSHLFTAHRYPAPARPGFVLFSVLPVLVQRTVASFAGIDVNSARYYDIMSGFNVLVTLGITGCIFALGRSWTGSHWLALLGAAVYSLLCNANVWIRHMVAYQQSLLLFLLALWILSITPSTGKRRILRLVLAGTLTGLAYSCYPGHYAFVIINMAVALAPPRRIVSVAAFGLSSAAVIGSFELLARFTGGSYVADLSELAGSATMGDPREGFTFVWHYLRDVEGAAGVALFVLFTAFVVFLLWRTNARIPREARAAIIAAIVCYLFHASMGVLGGRTVFYGRALMVYLPLMVIGAVLALMHVRPPVLRRIAAGGLLVASAFSFVTFARQYHRIVYPAEFLNDTMAGLGRNVAYPPNALWGLVNGDRRETVEWLDPELMNVVDSRPDGSDTYVLLASHNNACESGARFVGVNLKFMWYVRETYDRYTSPEGYTLIAEATHPEVFPATGYEGRRPWERKRIQDRKYTMRIYERIAAYE